MTSPLSRRRFLAISAAAAAMPANAEPLRWQGFALGAQTSLTIHAPRMQAKQALHDIRKLLRRVESLFSLYDPNSQLSHLNRSGELAHPAPEFITLLHQAGLVHDATHKMFDPTIQPLWHALATGTDTDAARALIGWSRIRVTPERITLAKNQALTLNGIAQGFATDMARQMMKQSGLKKVLINIGEFAALGGPFTLGISDPKFGLVGTAQLSSRAIATSSPKALLVAKNHSHIMDPILAREPRWSTVSVEADSAAIADAASTAFCLMSASQISASLHQLPGSPRAILVGHSGKIQNLS